MLLVEHIFGTIWFTFGWVLVRSNEVLSLGVASRERMSLAMLGEYWEHAEHARFGTT